ncbi:dual specificity protein phosphatase 12-like [Amphiura filiformis]|uniref:dual specificity protein phosphatase 12-like n=1 Tax=Amphiura filiformis TaxID=82378 RepID=UPI003B2101EC
MNEVSVGIYIGDSQNAEDTPQLESCGITHVLSVELEKPTVDSKIQHKFVKMYDQPDKDLLGHLGECFKFIEDGLKEGKVLIHCVMGISRSTSVATAFLMYRDKITRDKALDLIKETRPYARPNDGFMAQLALFEAMGCQLDTSNQQFKQHRLEQLSYDMKGSGGKLPVELLASDPQMSAATNQQTIYRCRKCRRAVFLDTSILNHDVGKGQASFRWHKQTVGKPSSPSTGATGTLTSTCTSIFTEPVAWMEPLLIGETSGKLLCPKCDARLGSFNWAGQQCSCGAWITPAIQIHENRVDKSVHRMPPQLPR